MCWLDHANRHKPQKRQIDLTSNSSSRLPALNPAPGETYGLANQFGYARRKAHDESEPSVERTRLTAALRVG
jgi:hypothetical protein